GLTSDTLTTPLDTIHVYPTITRPTPWATVDGEIRDVAIDQGRGAIYLLKSNQWRIAVMSAATRVVTSSIPMPGYPVDLDLTAGGVSLIVSLSNQRALGIIDLRQAPLAATLLPLSILDTTTLDQRPWHLRVAANGKMFVALQGSAPSAYSLVEVDLGTGVQRLRADAGDNGNVAGGIIERSHDHTL